MAGMSGAAKFDAQKISIEMFRGYTK